MQDIEMTAGDENMMQVKQVRPTTAAVCTMPVGEMGKRASQGGNRRNSTRRLDACVVSSNSCTNNLSNATFTSTAESSSSDLLMNSS